MNTKFSVKTSALLLFFPYVHCKSFWRFNGTKHMNYLSNQFKHAHLSRWIDKFAQYLHGALCIINLFERWSVNFRQNHCCTVMMTIYVVVRCGISCWNIVWLFTFSQYKVCVCVWCVCRVHRRCRRRLSPDWKGVKLDLYVIWIEF